MKNVYICIVLILYNTRFPTGRGCPCSPAGWPCRLWQHARSTGQQVCQPRLLLQHPLCWWVILTRKHPPSVIQWSFALVYKGIKVHKGSWLETHFRWWSWFSGGVYVPDLVIGRLAWWGVLHPCQNVCSRWKYVPINGINGHGSIFPKRYKI